MASLRQIEANRRNAQKSTGPSSPEGKARSSRNAISHGVFAADIALDNLDEDQNALLALRDALTNHYQPAGEAEMQLVETLVSLRWRLSRIMRAEAGCIRYRSDSLLDTKTGAFSQAWFDSQPGGFREGASKLLGAVLYAEAQTLHQLSLYEHRLQRTLERTLERLDRLQRDPHRGPLPLRQLPETPAVARSQRIEQETHPQNMENEANFNRPLSQSVVAPAILSSVPPLIRLTSLALNSRIQAG